MTASDDLVSRLRDQLTGDHARGCQGRSYSCDCGYDLATEGLLELAACALEAKDAEIASEKEESASYHKFWIEERDKRITAESLISDLERQLAEERERCGSIGDQLDGGLQLLLAAVHADDPKREILVRVGDLLRDAAAIRGGAK